MACGQPSGALCCATLPSGTLMRVPYGGTDRTLDSCNAENPQRRHGLVTRLGAAACLLEGACATGVC